MTTITEPQQQLLAAIATHRRASMRIIAQRGVFRVGGQAFPLVDLHVLRAHKLVRRCNESPNTPVSLRMYEPTEAADHLLDTTAGHPTPAT